MDINIHNYEAFFLTYADGELSSADQKEVEQFVAENPALQEEFSLMLSCVLPAEEITFSDTAFLLKGKSFPENIQEEMLLQLDGELDPARQKILEKAISTEGLLQKEWSLLNKTKLSAETIEFTDKASLYKHETGKLVSGRFWKLAAAAVVLGICMLTGYKLLNSPEVMPAPSLAEVNNKKVETLPARSVQPTQQAEESSKTAETVQNSTASTKPAAQVPDVVAKQPGRENIKKNVQDQNVNTTNLGNINKDVAVQKNNSEQIILNPATKTINKITTSSPENTLASNDNKIEVRKEIIDLDLSPRKPNTALTAALQEDNGYSDTKIFYVDSKVLKQSKLGSFFRKVNEVIEKKNNIGNGKPLKIGNLQISL